MALVDEDYSGEWGEQARALDGNARSGRIKRGEDGLTDQQRSFVDALTKTKDITKAYKLAYNTENMRPSSIQREASKLVDSIPIQKAMTARLKEIGEEKGVCEATYIRRMVIENLKAEAMDRRNPGNIRVRCLELLGKIADVGLFNAKKEAETVEARTADQIEQAILARLEKALRVVDAKPLN